MKNSIASRIKISKNGKILRRAMSQCHFRAKRTAAQKKRKKKFRGLNISKKVIQRY